MDAVIHTILVVLGISVRFDTVAAHGMTGFGYTIAGRSYTAGGYPTLAAARRAAPGHVRRALAARDKAREANARREREMRTIGSWGAK
jgi:hypothetical protein